MALMALGVNHQTAAIDIRQRLVFDGQAAPEASWCLVDRGLAQEAVVISTCNRTELYCVADNAVVPWNFLIGRLGCPFTVVEPYTYQYVEREAVAHLMRVASGLNSMIMGEGEILGQLKRAYAAASAVGSVGKHLDRLFQATFGVAKRARYRSGIGLNSVSIAHTAAKLSQHIFADLAQVSVLLVGAGDLIRIIAEHFAKLGVKKMMIANRTKLNGERLAAQFRAEACELESIPQKLAMADIVITGTASVLPILGKGMVERALRSRKRKPIFMVDLSVPRNIEPEIGELEDVYLYCIDDLQMVVEENKHLRREAAKEAEVIIEKAAGQFMEWLRAQESFKILSDFRRQFEAMRDQLLEKSLQRLQHGQDPQMVVKRLAYLLTNRFLHRPTQRLREASLGDEKVLLNLTKELFELECETFHTK